MNIQEKALKTMHGTRSAAESLRTAYYMHDHSLTVAESHFNDAIKELSKVAAELGYKFEEIEDEVVAA